MGGIRADGAGRGRVLAVLGIAAALALVGGGAASHGHLWARPAEAAAAPAAAAVSTPSASAPAAAPVPLTVLGIRPSAGSTGVAADLPVVVRVSTPLAAGVTPVLSPARPGRWTTTDPTRWVFTPTAPVLPGTHESVALPAHTRSAAGAVLAKPFRATWTARAGDETRLQQLLATGGYLPVSATPAATGLTVADAFTRPAVRFAARGGELRPALAALWAPGQANTLTRAAVMSVESAHHLAVDGVAGPQVWTALLADAAHGARSARPYTSVEVSKTGPESLVVYRGGRAVLSTPANTGVAGAPTPDGSWPVYARYASQTMSGTNPDGSHYSDPGVPWISYFTGGDAVHGFPRASYGSPQSVGCVELPIPAAKTVYGLLDYGTIVTVRG